MTPAECVAATKAARADVMLLWHECVDEAMLEAGRLAGLPVGAAGGTANEADIKRLLAIGDVVRITTNYPAMCRALVHAARGLRPPA
jgi:NAD(P)H-dependent flavin oxidoreductase YrpB (nitropropane dioxygenase family)